MCKSVNFYDFKRVCKNDDFSDFNDERFNVVIMILCVCGCVMISSYLITKRVSEAIESSVRTVSVI